jgi:hypothetical protein
MDGYRTWATTGEPERTRNEEIIAQFSELVLPSDLTCHLIFVQFQGILSFTHTWR